MAYLGRQSQCPHGLRRGSATVRLLGLRVRTLSGAWISVSCECGVLYMWRSLWQADHLSRGVLPSVCVCLCVCVRVRVCNREASTLRCPRPELGCCAIRNESPMWVEKRCKQFFHIFHTVNVITCDGQCFFFIIIIKVWSLKHYYRCFT
jgi:hypothetical protein